jgi:3-phosphoshikimate 1-carboxyvinyltransferase
VEVALLPDGDGALGGHVEGPPVASGNGPLALDCGNSGTSLRLLAGIVARLPGTFVLSGDASLRRRPVDRIIAPLRAMGAACAGDRVPPLTITGGPLRGVDWVSEVASAQVKSCILLAGLGADGPTTVTSPRPSRDHTERLLARLGADVVRRVDADGSEHVRVVPGPLRSVPIDVPGDPSSAAFWAAAAACGAGEVDLPGLCVNPTRAGVLRVLADLGAEVVVVDGSDGTGEPVGDVRVRPAGLGTAVVSGTAVVDSIDELPILALVGALSSGGLEVRDAGELRVKESDRIAAIVGVLGALGIEVEGRPDGYRVSGGQRPRGGRVEAGGDHRIAMTAAIAGVIGDGPVEITGFSSVATSYPSFLADLERLGGRYEVLVPRP